MPLKKKTEPEQPKPVIRIDPEMVEILTDSVKWAEGDVIRTREYLRTKELRVEKNNRKLQHYLKTGEILTEEQLAK